MTRQFIFLTAAAFAWGGCETYVDIDVPLEERKLVINSVAKTDTTWSVHLSYSRHVLDRGTMIFVPPKSTVRVVDANNGELVEELNLSPDYPSLYEGQKRPQDGHSYLLQVNTPGVGTAEANAKVPEPVAVTKVEADSSSFAQDSRVRLKITFADPAGISNFYSVQVFIKGFYIDYFTQDTLSYKNPIYLERPSSSLGVEAEGGTEIMFDDTFFDGREHTLTLLCRSFFDPTQQLETTVELQSLDEGYYLYKKTSQLQRDASGDPFAQPVLVFSNIKNGLGIFAAVSKSAWEMK